MPGGARARSTLIHRHGQVPHAADHHPRGLAVRGEGSGHLLTRAHDCRDCLDGDQCSQFVQRQRMEEVFGAADTFAGAGSLPRERTPVITPATSRRSRDFGIKRAFRNDSN